MSKKRSKKYNGKKLALQKVVGLTIRWSDSSPEMDSTGFMPGTVTHIKPLLRALAPTLYSQNKSWIVEQQPFLWRVELTGVFDYPNGQTQRETRELTAHIVLSELSEVADEQHRDMMRHGNPEHYRHTEFQVICLGSQPTQINAGAGA